MIPNKFVIIWNGQPIGLDRGGRPFKTEDPNKIKYWNTREEASYYSDLFILDSYIWYIHEIQFRIMDETK